MAQFCVYRNPNAVSRAATPFLLDVQSDLMHALATTVVVPLRVATSMSDNLMGALTPVLEVEGVRCVLLTPQLAGISRKQIGEHIADLSARRDEILAALDLLIMGI